METIKVEESKRDQMGRIMLNGYRQREKEGKCVNCGKKRRCHCRTSEKIAAEANYQLLRDKFAGEDLNG